MIKQTLESIQLVHLNSLVTDGVLEGLTLDFKEQANIKTQDGLADLIEDIVAFANAAGGDLVIGVREDRVHRGSSGRGTAVVGFELGSPDQFKLTIENALRDRVEPALRGIGYQFIHVEEEKWAAVIRVPNSHQFHLIRKEKMWFKSVGRNAAGNFAMGATQIREGILGADSLPQKIKLFRQERISNIYGGATPRPLSAGPKVVIHIMPLAAFTGQSSDFLPLGNVRPVLKGPITSMQSFIYNLDGLLAYTEYPSQGTVAHTQLFRNGIIENVDCELDGESKGVSYLYDTLDGYIANGLARLYHALSFLEVPAPFYVGLSLIDVKGCRIWDGSHGVPTQFIDRNVVVLPEIEVLSYDFEPPSIAKTIRPLFDLMFQSAGYEGSWNFDKEGKYIHALGGDYVSSR